MLNQKKISYAILSAVLLMFIVCILWNANWILGDDCQFLKTTAIGRPSGAYVGEGRFCPLGLVDYSILLLIPYGNTITAHLIYNSIIMIAAVLILFAFMNEIVHRRYRINAFFVLILFSTSSFLRIHMSCIYHERIMFFWLSVFMLFCGKGEKFQSTKHYAVAFFAAAYVTYAKEPVFGAIAIIALTNFIFRYEELSKKDRVFNCALLFNSAMFVGIYAYRRFRKPIEHLYANCFSNSYFDSTSALFNTDPLLYFFVIVFVIRLYFVLVKKDSAHLLLDGLLFAAIGYTIAYVLLGIASDYYIFPSMVLAIPSLAYWTSCLFKRNKPIATLILLISIFLVKDSAMTSKNIAVDILSHRKTDMPIVRRIVNQYLKGSEIVVFTESSTYESYIWNIYVYNNFINYCLGHKANILKKCSNPDDIPPNSLILCCKTSNPIFLKLDRFKIFHLVEKNALGMDIYISKNIAWEK